jgi:hypothetical protein
MPGPRTQRFMQASEPAHSHNLWLTLMADAGYFVPPSLTRYHQLIMPALQLLSTMFGSLGSSHATAGALVLEFFVSHRDVIALMLGNDQNPISLSALREAHMVVQACNMILPLVPKRELVCRGLHSQSTALTIGRHRQLLDMEPSMRRCSPWLRTCSEVAFPLRDFNP